MNYEFLKDKPARFETLTGYKLEEFIALLLVFRATFLEHYSTITLNGEPRIKRRYSTYKTSCLPSFEDKLLFVLVYLRKAPTQDMMGELFGMCQLVANKWIHRLLPIVNRALAKLGELPSRETSPSDVDMSVNTSVNSRVSKLFFMMLLSVQSNARKTHKFKRLIIVVKRNNGRSRIILLSTQKVKLCF